MSVLDQFNTTLLQFLNEIHKIFPSSKAYSYSTMLNVTLSINKKSCIDTFMESAMPHEKQILTSDSNYFTENDIEFAKDYELDKYFALADELTKKIMWQYIKTLFLLGCSYKNYSPDLLNTVTQTSKKHTGDVSVK